ncbi:ABC-2 family transporter protein [Candidatus Gottesmanbacteria bacterium]|nr:ABC-2 family transporter protein [Candidatus Gottesmanbacteria bacterium]
MKKYYQIFSNTWQEYMTYRLNFVMWRVRVVLRLLIIYFLWQAVFGVRQELFGYSREQMLTYVLFTPLITSIITGSRSMDIGNEINQGDLSNYLLRPTSYFRYWWTKDLADKALNIIFSIFELIILFLVFRPPIFWQPDLFRWLLFLLAIAISTFLYFYLNVILAFVAFWTPDYWGPRFLIFMVQEFLTGGIFPLDILPKNIFNVILLTPFPYLTFFPLAIYLGKSEGIYQWGGLLISSIWAIIFFRVMILIWRKGLKTYTADGR